MTPTDSATRILDAASELFAERGYQATTTRLIAERAGVNEVTMFRAFGNKQGVLRAIADRFGSRQPSQTVAGLAGAADLRVALLGLAHQEVANGLADGGLVSRLAFEARSVPEVAEVFQGGPQGNLAAVAELLELAQARGELRTDLPARVIAEGFFALTSSFVIMRTLLGFPAGSAAAVEAEVDQLFELFWSGATRSELAR
ncbi:MAG: TetR/AcrR family transcriptional regulator [Propionibacteriaceae bacterium]|nr:TetR/AcrR family transcriptional regulator [Propionibacteriaceae bacterium]